MNKEKFFENSVTIKKLQESDSKKLFNLLNDLDIKTKYFFHPHLFDIKTIKKICTSKNDYYYVMILNDDIIGYSFLRLFEYDIPSFGIVIKRGLTGKGFGKILTRWTIDKAKLLGFKKVILKTYKENISAQKLYKEIGFEIVGESDDKKQYKMEIIL